MAKTKKTKEIVEKHASTRLRERYGVNGIHIIREISTAIQNRAPNVFFILKQTSTRTVYKVFHPKLPEQILVVYDKERKSVVTVLPKGATGERPTPEHIEKTYYEYLEEKGNIC